MKIVYEDELFRIWTNEFPGVVFVENMINETRLSATVVAGKTVLTPEGETEFQPWSEGGSPAGVIVLRPK